MIWVVLQFEFQQAEVTGILTLTSFVTAVRPGMSHKNIRPPNLAPDFANCRKNLFVDSTRESQLRPISKHLDVIYNRRRTSIVPRTVHLHDVTHNCRIM